MERLTHNDNVRAVLSRICGSGCVKARLTALGDAVDGDRMLRCENVWCAYTKVVVPAQLTV